MLIQDSNRYYGQYNLNPLKFGRLQKKPGGDASTEFFLKQCTVSLGSQEVEGLNCDTTGSSFKDHYYRLFNILNMDHGKSGCSLTFEDWVNNFNLLVYDFR